MLAWRIFDPIFTSRYISQRRYYIILPKLHINRCVSSAVLLILLTKNLTELKFGVQIRLFDVFVDATNPKSQTEYIDFSNQLEAHVHVLKTFPNKMQGRSHRCIRNQ